MIPKPFIDIYLAVWGNTMGQYYGVSSRLSTFLVAAF
jgi:hypothetical protein